MNMTKSDSNLVAAYGYDEVAGHLHVTVTSDGHTHKFAVPADMAEQFAAVDADPSKSLGAFFNTKIKGKYPEIR
jgi:hypothetical protein